MGEITWLCKNGVWPYFHFVDYLDLLLRMRVMLHTIPTAQATAAHTDGPPSNAR